MKLHIVMSAYIVRAALFGLVSVVACASAAYSMTPDQFQRMLNEANRSAATERLLSERLRIAKSETAKQRDGIIYKSDSFWKRFDERTPLRSIFDGKFSEVSMRQGQQFYYLYFQHYPSVCVESLPRESVIRVPRLAWTEWEVNGRVESRSAPRVVGEIAMPARYGRAWLQIGNIRDAPASVGEIFRDLFADFQAFLPSLSSSVSFQQFGCSSPYRYQLEENLLKFVTGQPSIQAAGEKVPGAAGQSDDLVSEAKQLRFIDACMLNQGDGTARSEFLCQCYASQEHLLAPENLKRYISDFRAFQIASNGDGMTYMTNEMRIKGSCFQKARAARL